MTSRGRNAIAVLLAALGAFAGTILWEFWKAYVYQWPNVERITASGSFPEHLHGQLYGGVVTGALESGLVIGSVFAPICLLTIVPIGLWLEHSRRIRSASHRVAFVIGAVLVATVLAAVLSNRHLSSFLAICLPVLFSAGLLQLWQFQAAAAAPNKRSQPRPLRGPAAG